MVQQETKHFVKSVDPIAIVLLQKKGFKMPKKFGLRNETLTIFEFCSIIGNGKYVQV